MEHIMWYTRTKQFRKIQEDEHTPKFNLDVRINSFLEELGTRGCLYEYVDLKEFSDRHVLIYKKDRPD